MLRIPRRLDLAAAGTMTHCPSVRYLKCRDQESRNRLQKMSLAVWDESVLDQDEGQCILIFAQYT